MSKPKKKKKIEIALISLKQTKPISVTSTIPPSLSQLAAANLTFTTYQPTVLNVLCKCHHTSYPLRNISFPQSQFHTPPPSIEKHCEDLNR